MIILEGADCIGKTTAARRICELADVQYRHMSRPPEDFDNVADYMDGVFEGVHDRYHLGAVVYGQMLDLGPRPTARQMRLVQRYLKWQGCVTVIMYCERWKLEELLDASSKDEMYSRQRILDANEGFRALTRTANKGEHYCDVEFDVTDGWPDDAELQKWITAWRSVWNR